MVAEVYLGSVGRLQYGTRVRKALKMAELHRGKPVMRLAGRTNELRETSAESKLPPNEPGYPVHHLR